MISPMNVRWFAHPNDLIGGWCVTTVDKPPSQHAPGDFTVADFIDEATARYIAELHNSRLDDPRPGRVVSGLDPMRDPALAIELTMREREALMTRDDWSEQIDRVLSWPIGAVTPGAVAERGES